MFTGLIQGIGVVRSNSRRGGYGKIEVSYSEGGGKLRTGDSMAVNGVCLTATKVAPGFFSADLSEATRKHSTLGWLKPGERVNLERPVSASDPLGGHRVLGHVDCIGTIRRATQTSGGLEIVINAPAAAELLVDKGSVAIDGVSLTVGSAGRESFDVFIIPETQERTTLSRKKAGGKVNIEVDYLAKLVRKFLAGKGEKNRGRFPFAGVEE